ncbi:hypothetical protein H4R18_004853 [Coemansia javaensis]|uniref:Major facilitator superfamily (MFS) profile domain-containing protein n=1 Tax=Coemansia javaensis TaxID=2761396 RepID=A0A9W8LGG5_9FUNG|nr:hypothetical protein H4R18_004853 [Coemansia javaensis]
MQIRSKPATIWIAAALTALVNRLIYTLTIACIPDLLQNTMGVSRASNGIVTAAFGVGGLVGGTLAGYLSDRMQNRVWFQIGAAVLFIASGGVLFAAKRFYTVVLFRLVLGVASSVADTMLFTTVADVYPSNLLGLKMAVIFMFDNIGNMLGPLLGGKAYERMGVGGISIIAMSLGLLNLAMLLAIVRNSLDIRSALASTAAPPAADGASEQYGGSTAAGGRSLCDGADTESPSGTSQVSMASRAASKEEQFIGSSDGPYLSDAESGDGRRSRPGQKTHVWRLLLQLPVAGPTVSVFVSTGMQTVVETVLPLRLFDRFGSSPATISIAFLIVGGVLTVAMPAVGYANDAIVARHGERKRYYVIAAGALLVFLSQTLTALAGSYPVLVLGYALFATSSMVVTVPAQSAFGDFINASESPAMMAQCYSLAWLAEGLANILLPPVASVLYDSAGFPAMLLSMSAVLCAACAAVVLAFPIRQRWCSGC